MAFVGEAFLSAFIQKLVDMLASPELWKFACQERVHARLKMWEKILRKIYAVLHDAEEKQATNPLVKIWLAELRDLAYDVEDILDEFGIEALQRKLSLEEPQPCTSTVRSLISSLSTSFSPTAVRHNSTMDSKIEEITARLQDISSQKNDFCLRENGEGRSNRKRKRLPTTSLVVESCVYGRETDKEAILDMLLKDEPSENEACVISIVGMGGIGKTTLAQLAYNDEKVKDCFDMKAWVCVTDDFDVMKITKTILESIASNTDHGVSDLNLLQVALKEKVSGKKFLFVLDDLWNERCIEWDSLCSPLRVGARGSKLIITTRNMSVVSVTRAYSIHPLKELSHNDCLSVFSQQALGTTNLDSYPQLKVIGEEIVKKCKGLPLAAKSLGGMLRMKLNQDAWIDILENKIWDLPEEKSGILPALKLSYHHLPSHLKRCFAYCSMFPKSYEFQKGELILLWMAEGLLQHVKGKRQMEDIGSEYFSELLSRSFFQPSSDNSSRFVMHDLINDLAQSVGGEICFHLDDKLENDLQHPISEKVRHLSFSRKYHEVYKRFETFDRIKNLRTLLALPITDNLKSCMSAKVLHDLLMERRCLRVLSLTGYRVNELPSSFCNLKHLRYLNLSDTSIKQLPNLLSNLYNLQVLLLRNCRSLTMLPEGMGNLINLRHLDITGTIRLQEMPPRMGNLTNLQTLSKFIVGKGSRSGIEELKNLCHLRGEICISGLHNVGNIRAAIDANLKNKTNIEELMMAWRSDFDGLPNERDEMDVLEFLQPHKNLKKLTVEFYGGAKFPSWIGDASFSTLVQLNLKSCRNITSLPSLGRLSSLKDLWIGGMRKVKTIGIEFCGEVSHSAKPFQSLKSLSFEDMEEWEDWSFPNVVEDVEGLFPCLLELTLRNCPKLIGKLPSLLPSLLELRISNCPELKVPLPRLVSVCGLNVEVCSEAVLRGGFDAAAITMLKIRKISRLTCLRIGFMQSSAALESLVIKDCSELTSLWEEPELPFNLNCLKIGYCANLEKLPNRFQSLTSLGELKIEHCPRLVSFPETGLPPILRRLVLRFCEGLKSLAHNYTSCALEYLEILMCSSLICFPKGELPTTLKEMSITNCENLVSLPEGMMQQRFSYSNNTCCLHVLIIINCPSLNSFPRGKLPSTLVRLVITNCTKLEVISKKMLHKDMALEELSISNFPGLECLLQGNLPTNLRQVIIGVCENLKSLPHQMQNLTSLRDLTINYCRSLVSFPVGGLAPNLASLQIEGCENLKTPISEWGLHRLNSLSSLTISNMFPDMVSFSDDKCYLPTSLTSLSIWGMESLASLALQNLTSLQHLHVSFCTKLCSLVLPPTLASLEIKDCPILKERCLKDKGEDWPKISHIPNLLIDFKHIH